MLQNKDRHRWQ